MNLIQSYGLSSLFDDFKGFSYIPDWNIVEKKDKFLVSVDLPGMKKEEIKIDYDDGVLSVSGERKEETKEEGLRTYRKESRYGSFQRSVEIPNIDSDKINASYSDGVLKIEVPKSEKALGKRIRITDSI
jgi:HSP20 family protein